MNAVTPPSAPSRHTYSIKKTMIRTTDYAVEASSEEEAMRLAMTSDGFCLFDATNTCSFQVTGRADSPPASPAPAPLEPCQPA